MPVKLPEVYIGKNAISELEKFMDSSNTPHSRLVTDENEYEALGREVETAIRKLTAAFIPSFCLAMPPRTETYLIQVLLELDERRRVYLGVGSGTLTDIVRFCSHRAGMPFISLPTAASVDGFASTGCALTIQKYKQTIMAAAPVGIFADLDTLTHAPRPLIASGLATCSASTPPWQIGRSATISPGKHSARSWLTVPAGHCKPVWTRFLSCTPSGKPPCTN